MGFHGPALTHLQVDNYISSIEFKDSYKIIPVTSCWTGLPEDLCANHTGRGTNHTLERNLPLRTDSLVGRALVMIADDAGLIPAQSTISMTFLHGSSNSLWGKLFME